MATHKWPRLKLGKHPGKSFYSFVNNHWQQTHTLPAWRSRYSIMDEASDTTDKELLKILHSLPALKGKTQNITATTAKEHLALLGNIWKNTKVEREEEFLQVCLHDLMNVEENIDIATFLGWMVRCCIPTIFSISPSRELDPPYRIRATLSPGKLLLPPEYYLNPKLRDTEVWKSYEKFVSICAIELGLPFLHKAIEGEISLVRAFFKPCFHLAQSKQGKSWNSWMPEFEWHGFMSGLDIDKGWEQRIWTINAPEQFKAILQWVCSSSQETIISVLALHLIHYSSRLLRPAIREADNVLFHKSLYGITKQPSPEYMILSVAKEILPDALCCMYSKHHADSKLLANIEKFVSSLQLSAIDYMQHSSLLTKKTMTNIIEKLRRMKFILGNSKSGSMPSVAYTSDSFLQTVSSIQGSRTKLIPQLTGKSVDRIHSEYPCYMTNASYFPESNYIYLPWGMLQYPFYLDTKSEAKSKELVGWNHGALGAIICHEITHAFDLEGSLFTSRGQYKDTWTRKNRNSFKRQTRKITKFFGLFRHYGKRVDGKKTASENWADLGGLKISLNCLKRELSESKASDTQIKEAYRNFFIAYAYSWSTLHRKKSLLVSITKDIHAPAEDRVDRIVPQFQEWVDAFDIKESDPLYLAPGERLKFF